jgi:hypothetical protein
MNRREQEHSATADLAAVPDVLLRCFVEDWLEEKEFAPNCGRPCPPPGCVDHDDPRMVARRRFREIRGRWAQAQRAQGRAVPHLPPPGRPTWLADA